MISKKYLEELTYNVIGAAIEVHKYIGPGLLESVYHKCLLKELMERKIQFQSELCVPIDYKGLEVSAELRCDFLIEKALVIEIKAVESIIPIHEAQLFTYMKLLHVSKGLLLNFNCVNLFKYGQKTFVNDLFRNLPDE